MKRLINYVLCSLAVFILTGCGTVNERLLINKDGSGSVRLSLTVEEEYESQVSAYLNDYIPDQYAVKTVVDGFKPYKMFYIERDFHNLDELGYNDGSIKVDRLGNTYVYTISVNGDSVIDEVFTNEEMKQFLVDEEFDLEFSITLTGYPLTKPKIKGGNYDSVSKVFFPGAVTATWNLETLDNIELQASLAPMVIEWLIIIGLLIGIGYLLMRYFLVKNYGSDATLYKFINEVIVGKDQDEDY